MVRRIWHAPAPWNASQMACLPSHESVHLLQRWHPFVRDLGPGVRSGRLARVSAADRANAEPLPDLSNRGIERSIESLDALEQIDMLPRIRRQLVEDDGDSIRQAPLSECPPRGTNGSQGLPLISRMREPTLKDVEPIALLALKPDGARTKPRAPRPEPPT